MIRRIATISLTGLLMAVLALSDLVAQAEFQTGKYGVTLNNFGRIRILSPGLDGQRQIDRASIIVAVSPTEVYSYNNDADTEIPPANITPPTVGDFELFGAFNNEYSGDPPDIIVETNIYGWQNRGFALIRFNVKNLETAAIEAAIGLEILPQIDGQHGNESVAFIADEKILRVSKQTHVGFKILSDETHTLHVIDWRSGYDSNKQELFEHMTTGNIVGSYQANIDGTVIFLATDKVTIDPDGSAEIYFAFAIADDESDLVNAIAEAQAEYTAITSVVETGENRPYSFTLAQNYPNPFNPRTTIQFSVPQQEYVTLHVYTLLGQRVATLADGWYAAGTHSVAFHADNLPSGVYIYTLRAGEFQSSKRMVYIR